MSVATTSPAPSGASPVPPPRDTNPWKGLHFYTEQDHDIFFGRSQETAELLRLIRRDTLSVLFARSGLGKTSLLRAGAIPRLREEGFLPVIVRLTYEASAPPPTRQIIDAVLAGAASAGVDAERTDQSVSASCPGDRQDTLWEFFHEHQFWGQRNDPVFPVLILDQFEEVFTLGREGRHTAELREQLADLAENRMPRVVERRLEATGERLAFDTQTQNYRVVLSLREDFVPKLDLLRETMPAVMRNRFVLAPLDGARGVEVVRRAGAEWVSEAVAQEIVSAVVGESRAREQSALAYAPGTDVEPAYLSVMCHELFQRMTELGRNAIGSDLVATEQGNILDAMYERSFKELDPKTRLFVEDRLLTASGFRGSVPLAEVQREGIPAADLESLVDRRLLRFEDRLGTTHVELSHDLLTRIAQKSRDQRWAEVEREANRKREAEYRAKLRHTRQRASAVAVLAGLLLGVIGFYYFGWVRPYYSYCRNFTKKWGAIYPVGPLPGSAVAHRSWTLRLTRRGWFGPVQTAEVIDANRRLTPNHTITNYLADPDAAPSGREKESRYEFIYDREGRVVYEVAWNRFGQMTWGLVYSPHVEPAGSRAKSAIAIFLGPDGFPQPQGHSQAEFIEFDYDKRGLEVRRLYADRAGRRMPGKDDAYGQLSEYDKEGRLVRQTSLNEFGKPMNDNFGNAGQELIYDQDENLIEERAFDAKGRPTLVKGDYYRWITQYDKWGRAIERRFFGLSEPTIDTDQAGAHRVAWKFDDRGNIVSTKLYDTEDRRIVAGARIFDFPAHEERVTFDAENRVESVAYFDRDGKPLTGRDAWHGYRLEYDKRGFISAVSYFDEKGKAARTKTQGIHRWERVNDAFGQIIEERFLDSAKGPVATLDGGYHLRKSDYDKAGNLVTQTYFDVAGKPVADAADGAQRFVRSFDRFRNAVLVEYFDAGGRPVNNTYGVHRMESNYDDHGAKLGSRWFDKNGLPTIGPDGVHYISYINDRHGLLTRILRLNANNRPVEDKDGIHETLCSYNDKRQQTKWQYFGLNHKPVNDKNGNHLVLREFDERGRETKITQLRADGGPNWGRELGIATRIQAFDRNNHWTEQSYYDTDNHLVTGPHGFAKGSATYADDGRVEVIYFGPDGKPVFDPLLGFAIRKFNSRKRGSTTESYHGHDGALITGPEGFAEARRHWGDDGTLLAAAWFGPGGSPVAGPSGYHRAVYTPGSPKTKSTARYYDAENRELRSLGPDTLVSIIFISEVTGKNQPADKAGVHAGDVLWRYGNWWFPKTLAAERSKGTAPDAIFRAATEAFRAERQRLSSESAAMMVIRNGKPIELTVAPLLEKSLGVLLDDRAVPVATFELWKTVGAGKRGAS
jgi:hypothetical protein